MQNHDPLMMKMTMALARVSRAYTSAADKVASEFGLSQAVAWPAVMIGRMGDGVRPGAVAEMLGLEPSSVVRVIDQLINAGLVERREDASDRRAKMLYLTENGRKRVAQIEKAMIPFRRKMLDGIDRADLEACMRVFDALGDSIRRFEEDRSK